MIKRREIQPKKQKGGGSSLWGAPENQEKPFQEGKKEDVEDGTPKPVI